MRSIPFEIETTYTGIQRNAIYSTRSSRLGSVAPNGERKQRIAAIIISLMICTALYGVLYLAMHFQG